ncbi:MAG: cyclic nucleotide-binding protein [Oleiphilus sp.]|nr:MAG: cyclic nucleotide-binding protein [Oleiphilus sp.]
MQAEQIEISSFLSQYRPFSQLPEAALDELARNIEITYFRAGFDILQYGDPIQDLYIVRSGAVETFRRTGELYNRLDQGGIFGQMGLMMNRRVRFAVKALEDTLLYCIPADLFNRYCDEHACFSDYFEADSGDLLRHTVSATSESSSLATVKAKSLIVRSPVCVGPETSVRDAAKVMTRERVSSLLVTQQNPNHTDGACKVLGIVTDRDLRMRALAEELPVETPLAKIMSEELVTLDSNAYVFEAMLVMLRQNLHHLPLMHKHKPVGVLALSDILQHESQSSLLFVRGIFTQMKVEDLALYARQLPAVYARMVNEGANSHMVGSAMSVIGRSFKQRLLALAEEKFGPPPVPYCFLALGSMARDEQLLVTDQDNAIVLDDRYEPALHATYFEQLASFVCDGLAACGYTYCSGDIMASNQKWRLTRTQWQTQFSDWIKSPDPQALLNSCIFFDLDGVWGELEFAETLKQFVAHESRNAPHFLANMAGNALNRTPPLGFFKGFVMEQDGRHGKSINLKRRGTAPLSDVIRVHALAVGSTAQNSFERLEDISEANLLPPDKGRELSDALEYISMVRIRHQASDVEQGHTPDNSINPDQLSSFERRNLKEAFQVLDKAQNFLKFRYHSKRPLS